MAFHGRDRRTDGQTRPMHDACSCIEAASAIIQLILLILNMCTFNGFVKFQTLFFCEVVSVKFVS